MSRGRRKTTLSQLETRLVALDAERVRLVDAIKAAFHHILGSGQIGRPAARATRPTAAAGGRRRRMSAVGRAKLRAAAKRRWAEAKKAGRTSLG